MDDDVDGGAGSWRELLSGKYLGTATVLAGGTALYATNVYVTASLLPTAIDEIGGQKYYAWTSTVFLIASVVASMFVTRLVGSRGPRGAYLTALGFFALGTLFCALAPSMEMLLVGRVVQGIGGGLLAGLSYAVINAALPGHLWGRSSALVSAMWGIGTFVGPAVGGVFAQLGIWRWAFGALIVVAFAVAALVPSALPARSSVVTHRNSVPVFSLLLLTAAALVVSIASVLSSAGSTALLLVLASALVVMFVVVDRRSKFGILPRSTFTTSTLKWFYLTMAVLAIASTAETFISLFGQRLAGLAPLAAGFLGATLAVGWTAGEIPSVSASKTGTVKRIVIAGPLLVAVGLTAVAVFVAASSGAFTVVLFAGGLIVTGAGIGIAWPHLAVGVMSSAPDPAEGARASAAINTVQLIASAFGTALAGVLVNLGQPSDQRSVQLLFTVFAILALIGGLFARRAMSSAAVSTTPNPEAQEALER